MNQQQTTRTLPLPLPDSKPAATPNPTTIMFGSMSAAICGAFDLLLERMPTLSAHVDQLHIPSVVVRGFAAGTSDTWFAHSDAPVIDNRKVHVSIYRRETMFLPPEQSDVRERLQVSLQFHTEKKVVEIHRGPFGPRGGMKFKLASSTTYYSD